MRSSEAIAIKVAVFLLPRDLRERYREQWSADVRDAEEAGIPSSEIARGALAFAVTRDRPLFTAQGTTAPHEVARRSCFAAGLALSSALVMASYVSRVTSFGGGLTGDAIVDFSVAFADSMLSAYSIIAVIVAGAMVSATRGVPHRVRTAVWLLISAAALFVAAQSTDVVLALTDSPFAFLGTAAYVVGLGLVVAAGLLLVKEWGWGERKRGARAVAAAISAGVVTLAVAGLGLAHAMLVWSSRVVIEFSWQSGEACDEVRCWEIPITAETYNEWLRATAQFEQSMASVLVGWGIVGLLLAIAVATLVLFTGLRPGVATIAAVSILLIAHARVMSFVQLGAGTEVPYVSTEVMLVVGQWMLVAVVLYGVGGVRLTPRTHNDVGEPVAS